MQIGIDLGGTKIEIAVLNQNGEIIKRARTPTPKGDYAATIDAICLLVAEAENELSIKTSVGIAIPGAVNKETGLIKNANSTCLIGNHLEADLSKKLDRPVRLANDANCFTLSEAIDGAAKDHQHVFGVILGTGAGGACLLIAKFFPGEMQSPENGDIIPCRGPIYLSCLARIAIAV